MKITRDTPDQLIVESTPWIVSLGLVAGGLVFLAVGMVILMAGDILGLFLAGASLVPFGLLLAFARRVQVLFLRTDSQVIIRNRSFLGRSEVMHGLHEVTQADVQTSRGSDGKTTSRLALVIAEGQSAGVHPLTLAYNNYSPHSAIAQSINAWLAQAKATAP